MRHAGSAKWTIGVPVLSRWSRSWESIMSVDPKFYAFAQTWLAGSGYTWTGDIERLAQQIQDVAEDFVTELQAKELKNAD